MINVKKYTSEDKNLWDDFVQSSKNGVFLFLRDYMEYHKDRFEDNSLIFLKGNKPVALLPANLEKRALISHGGLTFGGMVINQKMTTSKMLDIFSSLKEYLESNNIKTFLYKAIPHIYHIYPSEEDLYALFINNAYLVKREVSTAFELSNKLPYYRMRRKNIQKAGENGLKFEESDDYHAFMALKKENLFKKYGVNPTHTGQEMEYLAGKFPDNIKLYSVKEHGEMIGGVIIYESANVAHGQYHDSTDEGKDQRVSDFVFDNLFNNYYKDTKYFDFGISTENNGFYLNKGLVRYKESFGGRAVVYDTYKMDFLI